MKKSILTILLGLSVTTYSYATAPMSILVCPTTEQIIINRDQAEPTFTAFTMDRQIKWQGNAMQMPGVTPGLERAEPASMLQVRKEGARYFMRCVYLSGYYLEILLQLN
jgi:hypothetical protein